MGRPPQYKVLTDPGLLYLSAPPVRPAGGSGQRRSSLDLSLPPTPVLSLS